MKNLFLILIGVSLLSFTLAGELQSLHSELTADAEPAQSQSESSAAAPSKGNVKAPPGTVLVPNTLPPRPKKTNISEIGIERTRCYANCPAYTFIIQADGTFRYTGEYGVERLGEYTGTVEQGTLNQVLRFIDESDFMSFNSSYTTPFLDSATTYTLVTKNDEQKVIENYANAGPATLWAIEKLVEGLLETAIWDEGGGEM